MRDTGLVAAYRAVGAVVFVIGRVVFAARAAAVLADNAVVRISLVNLARRGITVLALRAIVILTYVRCALDRYAAVLANGAIGCRRTVITNGSDMLTVFAGGVAKVLILVSGAGDNLAAVLTYGAVSRGCVLGVVMCTSAYVIAILAGHVVFIRIGVRSNSLAGLAAVTDTVLIAVGCVFVTESGNAFGNLAFN